MGGTVQGTLARYVTRVFRRIRPSLEYVLASRFATMGRIGLGLRRDPMGRAEQHRILEGLCQGTHWSQLRAGPSRTWTANLLRHRDYGIGRPSGDFQPAQHWAGSPSKLFRNTTRRAAQPFGGAGLSSGSVRWRTRKRTTAGGPSGAMDTWCSHSTLMQRVVRTRPLASLGFRPAQARRKMQQFKQSSNYIPWNA
jgi:hypothetical protein